MASHTHVEPLESTWVWDAMVLMPSLNLFHNQSATNCTTNLLKWRRTTIKTEPGVEIEQNCTVTASSPKLSLEMKIIEEENGDFPTGVIDYCDGNSQEFEHKDVDKDLLHNQLATNCTTDLLKWRRTTIKTEPGVEIEQNCTVTASSPKLSFEMKISEEENGDFPTGVIDYCDGNTQEFEHKDVDKDLLHNQLATNCTTNLLKWRRTTIKTEPGVEIEQNCTVTASSPKLSFEMKIIEEENGDFPTGVIGYCDGNTQEFKYKDVEKEFNQETLKNAINSTIPNVLSEKELTDVNVHQCDICQKCFTLRNMDCIAYIQKMRISAWKQDSGKSYLKIRNYDFTLKTTDFRFFFFFFMKLNLHFQCSSQTLSICNSKLWTPPLVKVKYRILHSDLVNIIIGGKGVELLTNIINNLDFICRFSKCPFI
ncbi:hypothetical protein GQR58_025348 [Nymphon striatum]|nr:hypothetical protein GQR58_025348 [Nymphon striatum]